MILAFARITNFALLLASPILLVRFLEPEAFGQYREFLAYAMLTAMLAAFSAKSNLLYFIPKDPTRTSQYVSNTAWIVLGTSSAACLILFLFRDLLLGNTSYDFLLPLCLYVLFFTNMDILESYWIATKQPGNVFVYSVARTAVRVTAMLATAYMYPTVQALLITIVSVEAARILVVFLIVTKLPIALTLPATDVIRSQFSFVIPLGLAGSLHHVNQYAGQIAISSFLGPVALAIYAIGSYQIPVLQIVRGSINDSIFPDMVRQASEDTVDRLRLWKRSNVAYTLLIVPVYVLLVWYADDLIPLVFTDKYADSVPIFRILVTVMLLQCFEFSSPLRALSRTGILLVANSIMVAVNIGLIIAAFVVLPAQALYAPAIAIVAAYVVQLAFLGLSITRAYKIRPVQLMKWRSLAIIAGAAALAMAALAAGEVLAIGELMRLVTFSSLFLIIYFSCLKFSGIEEFSILLSTVTRRLRRR